MNYGAETMIFWLEHFDKVISTKDYPLYRNLERETCRICGISISDMHLFSNTQCTNAKRIISFIATQYLKLSVPAIANLLGLSDRAINYYIKDVIGWTAQPNYNKEFMECYNKVVEKLNIK